MRNKLLEKEIKAFYSMGCGDAVPLNAIIGRGMSRGLSAISDAQRMIDFLMHEGYSPFPGNCFNEPEMVRLAAEKLYDGIERAKELLAILEKHYGEVEKKPRGGSFSCCDPCACESSPGRPQ